MSTRSCALPAASGPVHAWIFWVIWCSALITRTGLGAGNPTSVKISAMSVPRRSTGWSGAVDFGMSELEQHGPVWLVEVAQLHLEWVHYVLGGHAGGCGFLQRLEYSAEAVPASGEAFVERIDEGFKVDAFGE